MHEDGDVAEALVRAAGEAVLRVGALDVEAKTSATDVVTRADREAEAAMVAILRSERPGDGVLGEEGADVAGGGRTWLLDALDGTWNFAAGLPAFCCAAVVVADASPLASAVLAPSAGELFRAAAGRGAGPLRASAPERLRDAVIASFAHPAKTDMAGVLEAFTRLIGGAGQLRMTGTGTLELAWVAAGRLDGWAQPASYPWDWHPGALLVTEAGGAVATVDAGGTPWQLAAGNAALLEELAATVSGRSGFRAA